MSSRQPPSAYLPVLQGLGTGSGGRVTSQGRPPFPAWLQQQNLPQDRGRGLARCCSAPPDGQVSLGGGSPVGSTAELRRLFSGFLSLLCSFVVCSSVTFGDASSRSFPPFLSLFLIFSFLFFFFLFVCLLFFFSFCLFSFCLFVCSQLGDVCCLLDFIGVDEKRNTKLTLFPLPS